MNYQSLSAIAGLQADYKNVKSNFMEYRINFYIIKWLLLFVLDCCISALSEYLSSTVA